MIEEGGGRQDVVQSYVGEGTRDVRRGGEEGKQVWPLPCRGVQRGEEVGGTSGHEGDGWDTVNKWAALYRWSTVGRGVHEEERVRRGTARVRGRLG